VELQAVSENETRLTARVMHADSATCEDHAKMGFPHGWHVALAYVIGFFIMLMNTDWKPTEKIKGMLVEPTVTLPK
jgi:hypothetical protein